MNPVTKAVKAFIGDVNFSDPVPVGNGHINSTYLVKTANNSYCLQKINTSIFKDIDGLMNNIEAVTDHIRKKTAEAGGDVVRGTLRVIPTLDGADYFRDSDNSFCRMVEFVEGTVTKEVVEDANDFYTCAKAF